MTRTVYSYDRVAWCYEAIAAAGSLGAIPRMKAAQVEAFVAGQRVLYVGVGAGEDAVLAARRGVELTCLDRSPAMLRRLDRRLARGSLRAELVQTDLRNYAPAQRFDAVVANFFFNVFEAETVEHMLARIAPWLELDGRLYIADFRPAGHATLQRILYNAYYKPLNWGAWALGLCALHPIYDYALMFERSGLRLLERTPVALWDSRALGRGPQVYEEIVAARSSAGA